jgi:hypothetical protein
MKTWSSVAPEMSPKGLSFVAKYQLCELQSSLPGVLLTAMPTTHKTQDATSEKESDRELPHKLVRSQPAWSIISSDYG